MSDPRTDIPTPNAPNFEQRIRETLMTYLGRQGNPLDRGVTLRDLLENGLAKIPQGYTLRSGGATIPLQPVQSGELDLTPPPQPTGFTVNSAISHVFIEHAPPLYFQGGGHLRTRVYGVTVSAGDPAPVFADAVEITQFTGTIHAHPSNPSTTWHLWIKWESRAGVLSPTPAGGANGLVITTGQDVSTLLTALDGQIRESQLFADLGARINLVDGPASLPGSVAARIATESASRTAAIAAEATARANAINQEASTRAQAILDEAAARSSQDGVLQQQINLLSAASSGDFTELLTALQEEQTARIAGDAAEATARQTLATQLRGSYTGTDPSALTTGLVFNERQARIAADGVIASDVSALSATVTNNFNTLNAAITTEQTARVNGDTAISTQLNTVSATANAKNRTYRQNTAPTTGLTTGDIWYNTASNNQASRWSGSAWVATDDTRIATNAAAISTEQTARINGDNALASQITSLTSTVNTNNSTLTSAIQTESSTRASADNSLSTSITTLNSQVNNATTGLPATRALLLNDYYTKTQTDSAISSATSTLVSTTALNNALGNYTTTALLQQNYYTKTQTDSAIASATSTLVSTTALNSALSNYTTTAQLQQNYYTKTQTDSAISSSATTLTSTFNNTLTGYATTAALQTEATTRANADNSLFAQYTVKVDLNGYVSGFGLASTAVNSTPFSQFLVRADSFAVANPGGPGIAPATPFIVRTTTTTIGGQTVNPGVYITDAFIQNGTISSAKIANLAVDNAKIANVSADKFTAGSISVGQHIQSSGYVAGQAGWRINGNGDAEFSNVVVRGSVVGSTITGGTINGSIITGATLRTAASGQRIEMDANGLLFLTGATSGKYGQFKYGQRKYGSGVLVYFNNSVKRVPFYVSAEQNVADIHLYNRGANPVGGNYEAGDMICVNGRLRIFVPALGGWKTVALEP
jgi:hypothetical protein